MFKNKTNTTEQEEQGIICQIRQSTTSIGYDIT